VPVVDDTFPHSNSSTKGDLSFLKGTSLEERDVTGKAWVKSPGGFLDIPSLKREHQLPTEKGIASGARNGRLYPGLI